MKWLQDEDAWWSTQTTADMVFGSKDGQRGGDPYNDPRAVSFRNIFCSIEAIGNYRTPETKAIVERIREHWKAASPFDSNNDPIKCCDDTLAALK